MPKGAALWTPAPLRRAPEGAALWTPGGLCPAPAGASAPDPTLLTQLFSAAAGTKDLGTSLTVFAFCPPRQKNGGAGVLMHLSR